MVEIRSLYDISTVDLYAAMTDAFSDYPYSWSREEFVNMLLRRGYAPELSFGAFAGERLVSYTLNCMGSFDGKQSAYDTGTGTIKEFRGKGLATKIFEHSLPYLEQAGIRQYILEVLRENAAAISVYKNAGFTISRELNCFFVQSGEVQLNNRYVPGKYLVQEIGITNPETMKSMWDFSPSWQNSLESVGRVMEDFVCLGVFDKDKLIAYGITAPAFGDITQLAVSQAYRRQGIGSGLLKEMIRRNRHTRVKMINTDKSCESITALMTGNNFPLTGLQYEMVRKIG